MACDCLKKKNTGYDKIRTLAKTESKIDKVDYIIYQDEGKTYHERKECWEKAGRPGKIEEIIYYI